MTVEVDHQIEWQHAPGCMLHLLVESASHSVLLLARHWLSEKDTKTCQIFKWNCVSKVFFLALHFFLRSGEVFGTGHILKVFGTLESKWVHQGTRCCGKLRSRRDGVSNHPKGQLIVIHTASTRQKGSQSMWISDIARPLCPWAPSSSVASRVGWLFNRFCCFRVLQ